MFELPRVNRDPCVIDGMNFKRKHKLISLQQKDLKRAQPNEECTPSFYSVILEYSKPNYVSASFTNI